MARAMYATCSILAHTVNEKGPLNQTPDATCAYPAVNEMAELAVPLRSVVNEYEVGLVNATPESFSARLLLKVHKAIIPNDVSDAALFDVDVDVDVEEDVLVDVEVEEDVLVDVLVLVDVDVDVLVEVEVIVDVLVEVRVFSVPK